MTSTQGHDLPWNNWRQSSVGMDSASEGAYNFPKIGCLQPLPNIGNGLPLCPGQSASAKYGFSCCSQCSCIWALLSKLRVLHTAKIQTCWNCLCNLHWICGDELPCKGLNTRCLPHTQQWYWWRWRWQWVKWAFSPPLISWTLRDGGEIQLSNLD